VSHLEIFVGVIVVADDRHAIAPDRYGTVLTDTSTTVNSVNGGRGAGHVITVGTIPKKGDIRHIKMALELMDVYPSPKPTPPGRDPLPPYTAEEYTKAIEDVAAWHEQQFGNRSEEDGKSLEPTIR
jgi:hypothetical protein